MRLPTAKGAAADGAGVDVEVAVRLEVGVVEGVAVMERVPEGVVEVVGGLEGEKDVDPEPLADGVSDVDAELVGVTVAALEPVCEGDGELVPVAEAAAPVETVAVAVGVLDGVSDDEGVVDGVSVDDSVGLAVPEMVGVVLGVGVAVGVGVVVGVGGGSCGLSATPRSCVLAGAMYSGDAAQESVAELKAHSVRGVVTYTVVPSAPTVGCCTCVSAPGGTKTPAGAAVHVDVALARVKSLRPTPQSATHSAVALCSARPCGATRPVRPRLVKPCDVMDGATPGEPALEASTRVSCVM
jgi:hypothetical protein